MAETFWWFYRLDLTITRLPMDRVFSILLKHWIGEFDFESHNVANLDAMGGG